MSRRNVTDLPWPSAGYVPGDLAGSRFETCAAATAEDRLRASCLGSTPLNSPARRTKAITLAQTLSIGIDDKECFPETMASARYMRDQRQRIGGALWKLVDAAERHSTFTLLPRDGVLARKKLDECNPKQMKQELRSALYRAGAGTASGWLFAGIHGDYDERSQAWQLEWHGSATGDMIEVVDALRKQRRYQPDLRTAPGALGLPNQRPIVVSRQPVTDLETTLPYAFQSFWACRSGVELPTGQVTRERRKHRLPELEHCRWLCWIDRQHLMDMTLLVHLRVTSSGLVPNR